MSYILPDCIQRRKNSDVIEYYMNGELVGECKANGSWSLKYTTQFTEGTYFIGLTGERGLLDRMYSCALYPLREINFWYPPKLTITGEDGYYYVTYDDRLVGLVTEAHGWALNRLDGTPFLRGPGGLNGLLLKMAELNLYGVVE